MWSSCSVRWRDVFADCASRRAGRRDGFHVPLRLGNMRALSSSPRCSSAPMRSSSASPTLILTWCKFGATLEVFGGEPNFARLMLPRARVEQLQLVGRDDHAALDEKFLQGAILRIVEKRRRGRDSHRVPRVLPPDNTLRANLGRSSE
jgi:hypothetical protein